MLNLELIKLLKKFPYDMPVAINDCIDFTTVNDKKAIGAQKKEFATYPFTDSDKFNYINLTISDKEYWDEC